MSRDERDVRTKEVYKAHRESWTRVRTSLEKMEELASRGIQWENAESSTIRTPDDSIVQAELVVEQNLAGNDRTSSGKRSLGVGPVSYGSSNGQTPTKNIEAVVSRLEMRVLEQEIEELREYNHNLLWELECGRKECARLAGRLADVDKTAKDVHDGLRGQLAVALVRKAS
jgi:chromosome segregation ATPase